MASVPPKTYRSAVVHPGVLASQGPLIQLAVKSAFPVNSAGDDSAAANIIALVDTGASGSSISMRLVDALNLSPVRNAKSIGAQGDWQIRYVYVVDLKPVGSDLLFRNWPVVGLDLHGGNYDMLVGRDILSLSHFAYDGAHASFSLTVPSFYHPLCEKPQTPATKNRPLPDNRQNVKRSKSLQKTSRKRNRPK